MERRRVLVADDDRNFRFVVSEFLSNDASIEVVAVAMDAADAIAQAGTHHPDVAILDVRMPGGGPEAARGIRRISPTTQILALSGNDDVSSVFGMFSAGAIGYALKSDMKGLVDAVNRTAFGIITVAIDPTTELVETLLTDVVEHARDQAVLAEALERERTLSERHRALDEMKTALLTSVSHELRTPLTTVLGVADTLQRRDEELAPEMRKELLVRLDAQARRLSDLLGDLLDLDRVSRGIIEAVRRPTDIGALVMLIVEEWQPRLSGRPLTVDAPSVIAEVDPSLVGRIVENLLSNVTRHTPPGTAARIAVGRTDEGGLITVADAGPGIPEHVARTVFEPFHRGTDPDHPAPGMGVGLSLVSRFAELHGGRAWVERAPEGGAAVYVLLPEQH